MPPLAGAIAGVGGLLTSTALGSLVTQTLTGLAINSGIGLLINAFASPPDEPAPGAIGETGTVFDVSRGGAVPVDAVMGRHVAANHLWYHNWFGTDNEYGQVVYRQGYGEYDGLEAVLIDGQVATLSGSNADARGFVVDAFKVDGEGAPSPTGTPHLWVKYYTGAVGQVADPQLVTDATPSGRWTASDKMTGMPYVIVTYRYHAQLFSGALPRLNFVWRGLKLYDRRKDSTQAGGSGAHRWGDPSTYEFSECPAICQDNWRRGIWVNGIRVLGLGVAEAACHHGRIVAAANLSDEMIYYADTDTTRRRYVFGGVLRDGDAPIDVLKRFETAMGGSGTETGGAYGPLPAQTQVAVMTITDKDRVAGTEWLAKSRLSPLETVNAVHGTFTAPEFGWQSDPYGMRFDAGVEASEQGRRLGRLDLGQVNIREIAASLAEIERRRNLYTGVESLVLGPKSAVLEVGDLVDRQSDEVIGSRQMIVVGISEGRALTRSIVLREWNNAIVPTPSAGFVTIPADPVPVVPPARLLTVSGFGIAAATYSVGDSVLPALLATWVPISDITVDRVVIKFWPNLKPDEVRYVPVDEPGAGRTVIDGVKPNTDYVAEATIFTTPPRTTIWTNQTTATTGDLVVEVANDSIDIVKLSQELKNITQAWPRTLFERLDELETQIGDLAQTVMDDVSTQQRRVSGLSVKNSYAQAAVVRLEEVVLGPDGALAQLSDEVVAIFQNQLAGGAIRFKAEAGVDGAESQVIIQVWSEINQEFYSAGTMWQVFSDTSTRQVNWADQIVWTDGTAFVQPAVFQSGTLYLDQLKVAYISSPDGSDYWDLVGTDGWRVSVTT